MQRQIVAFMADGSYFAPACKAAGTTRQTVEYWQKLYQSGAEHAQEYADFFAALEKANAIAEVRALGAIQSGATSWQSRAWFLERRFPARWGAKDKADKNKVPADHPISKALREAADAIAKSEAG